MSLEAGDAFSQLALLFLSALPHAASAIIFPVPEHKHLHSYNDNSFLVCNCLHVGAGTCGVQERVPDPLELTVVQPTYVGVDSSV